MYICTAYTSSHNTALAYSYTVYRYLFLDWYVKETPQNLLSEVPVLFYL